VSEARLVCGLVRLAQTRTRVYDIRAMQRSVCQVAVN
jgi:hypothetical protein